MTDQEEWRAVVGFEDLYEVSSEGRVRSIKGVRRAVGGRLMQPRKAKDSGYQQVILCCHGERTYWRVHRLVLEAFVGPCPPGMECRHIHGVAGGDRLSNLKWGTWRENQDDKVRHGTSSGWRLARGKLTDDLLKYVLSVPGYIGVCTDLACELGLSVSAISKVRRGEWRTR